MNRFFSKTPATAKLFVVRGAATTDSVTIPLPCLIGRSREADLYVDSLLVSRAHCRLDLVDGKVFLVDLDSRNGTMINDQFIAEDVPVELGNHGVFSIGPLTFQLEFQPTKVTHDSPSAINSVGNLQLSIGN